MLVLVLTPVVFGRRLRLGAALVVSFICLVRCGGESPADAVASPPDQALARLFDEAWQDRLQRDPLLATSVGEHRYDDRLPAVDPASLREAAEAAEGFLARLDEMDANVWSREDRINVAILRRQLEDQIAGFRFGAFQIPFFSDEGFHTELLRLPAVMPLRTADDYARYIARLGGFPDYVDQHIDNMRDGAERGFTMPRVVLEGLMPTIDALVVAPDASVLAKPFAEFPESIPPDRREELLRQGLAAVEQGALPAFAAFRDFLRDEYLPAARRTIGATELPDGQAYYAQRVRHFTTLDLTPQQIHETGQSEVRRIRAEMQQVLEQVEFRGGFAEFLNFLRTDPRFYAKTADELLKEAAYISKRMDGQLPALFGHLPRLPYTVEPVPAHIAPNYTAGRYVPATVGSTHPGIYWVNTYDLKSRPLYALEALSLHEAVPGHHLQFAVSRELGEQPPFRRYDYISAYGEGWGLYSEWLGLEAGFYTDPYSNFGRLTYEMWRACRLVVDTGMHAMGWTRQQAMDFLAENTALSLHEIRTETDRYIAWPAQALSYKIGELKIKALRSEAEERLGQRFDVRGFHDTVLGLGSVPLPVLETAVRRWIAEGGSN